MLQDLLAGVDIGGTKTAVVISRVPPEVLRRIEFATEPEHGPEPTIARIKAALHDLLANKSEALKAIGLSCGGPLNRHMGIIQAPPNLSTWADVPIVGILAREFHCPVRLENDANAGALAEHRYGAGRDYRNLIFLTMGTGLGAGIILNGQLYCGTNDNAGEIGHVRLTRGGPVGYRKAGSVEGWASGGGMAQVAERLLRRSRGKGTKSVLIASLGDRKVTARDVGLAAAAGDAVAKRIISTCGRKLGEALAVLVDVLNPECIVIGGLAMRLGDVILDPARKRMKEEALAASADVCRVVPAQLGERVGDVGALCIAMDAVGIQEAGPSHETCHA